MGNFEVEATHSIDGCKIQYERVDLEPTPLCRILLASFAGFGGGPKNWKFYKFLWTPHRGVYPKGRIP